MNSLRVILADTHERYLYQLELIFLKELEDQVEIDVITDPLYVRKFFSEEKRADILIIDESLYDVNLLYHAIGRVYVLAGHLKGSHKAGLNIRMIPRLPDARDLFCMIMREYDFLHGWDEGIRNPYGARNPKILLITSLTGGVGKTTVALALCYALEQQGQNTFYIDAEDFQTFSFYLGETERIDEKSMMNIQDESGTHYRRFHGDGQNEGFDYLLPWEWPLCEYGLEKGVCRQLIQAARDSGSYDWIIIDSDSIFDKEKESLISLADQVICIINQNRQDTYDMEKYMSRLENKYGQKIMKSYIDYIADLERDGILSAKLAEYADRLIRSISTEDKQF